MGRQFYNEDRPVNSFAGTVLELAVFQCLITKSKPDFKETFLTWMQRLRKCANSLRRLSKKNICKNAYFSYSNTLSHFSSNVPRTRTITEYSWLIEPTSNLPGTLSSLGDVGKHSRHDVGPLSHSATKQPFPVWKATLARRRSACQWRYKKFW